jgi:hypothetical protein
VKRSSTIAGGLAALALAGGLTMAIPGTARADGIVPNQPWTEVVPAFTDHLAGLDDRGGSATSGTPIQLFTATGTAATGNPSAGLARLLRRQRRAGHPQAVRLELQLWTAA